MNELVTIKSPLSVNYEVTPVCDWFCEFCFNAKSECKNLQHPPLSQVKSILDALAVAEVFEVRLFGGEFFTYPAWEEVVAYADSLNFFMSFVSNGTNITKEMAEKLTSYQIVDGAISLHGPKEIHEAITGVKGSFDQTVNGIKACLDAGMGISVLYTLTRSNQHSVFDFCRQIKDIGVNEVNFGRLTPYGRARADWENSKLNLHDYLLIFRQIEKINTEIVDLRANFGDAFPLCILPEKYHEYVVGCWQGTGFGYVTHAGNICGCSIAQGSYGNILETPLTEIWTHRLDHFRSLQWLPIGCRECDTFCGGGCSASCFDGGMYAPDEFIPQSKRRQSNGY